MKKIIINSRNIAFLAFFVLLSCAEKADFTSGTRFAANAQPTLVPPLPTAVPPPGPPPVVPIPTPAPQVCSVQTGKVIQSDRCPANFAVFTIDDGSSPNFGCCALPAADIIVAGSEVQRSGKCAADEILTGIVTAGTQNYYCHKLNTSRYRLAAERKLCYYGSGSTGSKGTSKCGSDIPPAIEKIVRDVMGSDGCVSFPYGSLATGRTGKNCGDTTASQLLFVETGLPVPILP